MAISNYDYSKQIANLKNAQQKAATADLQNTKNQALSNLTAEQQQNTANYASQRNTANAQNRLNARNFQEYLANTGRANSGLGAQAAMQYNNNLNTSLNSIYGAENAANADILRRRTDAENAYNSGLAKANADIQANYIQALIDERNARFNRDMQIASQKLAEKEFQESIRQFNKNYDLQKRNFSRGSGGGGSRGGTSGGTVPFIGTEPKPKKKIEKVKTADGGWMWIDRSTISKNPNQKKTTKKNNNKNNSKGKNNKLGIKIGTTELSKAKK